MNPDNKLIENYRGFNIYFNTSDETFVCGLEDDKNISKKSYSVIKKAIDEFIKENQTFIPFEVVKNPFACGGIKQKERIKIVGIRKDGAFVAQLDGKNFQVSKYDEKNWMQDIEENEPIVLSIISLEIERDNLNKQINEEKRKLTVVTLEDLKPKYLPK